jgi:FKBP-type peptidyl-prolyl cis-trans isomerase 2
MPGKKIAANKMETDACLRPITTKEVLMATVRQYAVAMMAIVGCLVLAVSSGIAAQAGQNMEVSAGQNAPGPSAPITDGSKVTLLYQITVPGDDRIEFRDLSQFIQGQHQMVPALEQAVSGMHRGDKAEVKLTEDQAFGSYDAKKKAVVPMKELPAGVKTGDIIEDRNTGKQATIIQMSQTDAVMDYNHPLAGKPLLVTLTILDVDGPK